MSECLLFSGKHCFLFDASALLTSAADDSGDGRRELQKAIISLATHPSTETYPVEFSVGGIHYRMPRNYLPTMENWNGGPQALVTVTVNLPDLKPLSQETSACFTAKTPDRPPGCEPFSFRINAPAGPSPNQAFERNRRFFESETPIAGPSGFEQYNSSSPVPALNSTERQIAAALDFTIVFLLERRFYYHRS
jgi:hypothetical protein